jgi:hypothetical protein
VAKKATIKKKIVKENPKTEKPSVIFLDESANKSSSLIYLGVVAVILGFLSTTPLMARTIFSEKADFIVGMGLVGIVVGIILNNRKRISALFNSKKKA